MTVLRATSGPYEIGTGWAGEGMGRHLLPLGPTFAEVRKDSETIAEQ